MAVPKEHTTSKLESLSGDLRLRAEAIIKKRFNLEKPKAKKSDAEVQKTLNDAYNRLSDSMVQNVRPAPGPSLTLRHIEYLRHLNAFEVHIQCMQCGVRQGNHVEIRSVERRGYYREYVCSCGRAGFHVTDEQFREAYMASRRQPDPRYLQEYPSLVEGAYTRW